MSTVSSEWKLSAIYQRFTLPEDTIIHMAKNPLSPEVYHKLIKCCKYFWLKNPVITLNNLHHFYGDNYYTAVKVNGIRNKQRLKIENLTEKLWIHQDLVLCNNRNKLMASSLIERIYRCDLIQLGLSHQILTFDEFRKLTLPRTLEVLFLNDITVKNDDGTVVPFLKLIELLPNLQNFSYFATNEELHPITSETAAKLLAIPHFPKIKHFFIKGVPESFNIEAFFETPKVRTFSIV